MTAAESLVAGGPYASKKILATTVGHVEIHVVVHVGNQTAHLSFPQQVLLRLLHQTA